MSAPELATLLDQARTALDGVPRELLGEVVAPRFLGFARAPRIVLRDEVWHVGVLLISARAVYVTGEVVRSREPARRGYTAESQRERGLLAEAAYRGGILPGTGVHVGWRELDLDRVAAGADRDPIDASGAHPRVRWSASGGWTDLEGYLRDRIDLLRHPPQGAT